jgi:adenylosuccinate lyase
MKIFNKKKPIRNVINIFNKKNFFQSYLLAEREFTLALGDLGVIPKNSAFEIAKKCNINLYNLNKI